MIPPIAIVFPIFLLYVWFGWVDTYQGLIILYTAFNLPYVIWMMSSYIEDIPLELEESALVDGCTRFEVLRKVVFPMARAGLFATAVFTLTRNRYTTYGIGLATMLFTGWKQQRNEMNWVGNWNLWSSATWSDFGVKPRRRPAFSTETCSGCTTLAGTARIPTWSWSSWTVSR